MREQQPRPESLETFRLLYPIFKEEVYRRRATMGQIARMGIFSFVLLLFLVLYFGDQSDVLLKMKLPFIAGILLTSFFLIYQIIQEKSRHEQAKLQLITLEEGFDFFEAGSYLPEKALYPDHWKKRPSLDSGMLVSILCLKGSALLLILTILSQ